MEEEEMQKMIGELEAKLDSAREDAKKAREDAAMYKELWNSEAESRRRLREALVALCSMAAYIGASAAK